MEIVSNLIVGLGIGTLVVMATLVAVILLAKVDLFDGGEND